MRQFDKAFALMDKYVTALPKDANPQDSYAEILRMAGHFDEAIEHYKAALAINPEFYSSQFGIADTYSLEGDQVRARQEYELAFRKFPLPALHRIEWKTREAITYVRDGHLKAADAAFQAMADYAHANRMSQIEADTYRQMAMYQLHSQQALLYLSKADAALHEGNNVMPGAAQQEFAQILRARVELAIKTDDEQIADATLAQLAELSGTSDDKLIETAYHGAAGALLFSQHDYKHAALHLEEDIQSPLSLKLLAAAYQKTGNTFDGKRTGEMLANLNDPTLEQAMIVPAFRQCIQNPSCDNSITKASFKH
jgi:tetratricopeptide (TPR) repeat protein